MTPYGALDAVGTRTLEQLSASANYNRWIVERVGPALGRRVLEVGCGTGTITEFLLDRELVVAVDVEEGFVRSLRTRLGHRSNLVPLRQDLAESAGELARFRCDSAVSVNVFEHIADDVRAMRSVNQALEPGGAFALLVPGHPFLHGSFDQEIGHHRRYTKAGLRRKLEAAGFEVESVRRSNPVGAIGWLVMVRLLRRRQLQAVGFFDRLVPFLKRLDRVLEPPFGLSLVAVARKPRH